MKSPSRPAFIKEQHLDYLDNLRASGDCNMFMAAPHFQSAFPTVGRTETRETILYWMKSHSEWLKTGER